MSTYTTYAQFNASRGNPYGQIGSNPSYGQAVSKSSGQAPTWLIFTLIGILVFAIALLLVLDFIFYEKKKGWVGVYEPPVPENAVQPNKTSSAPPLPAGVQDNKTKQLTAYQNGAGGDLQAPNNWGAYQTEN